jgi:hypothetical protein
VGSAAKMRKLMFAAICGPVVAVTSAAVAVSAPAGTGTSLVLHSTLGEFTGRNLGIAGAATDILPGETFSITGDCVADAASADHLRVVLTFAGNAGSVQPGFRSVVAIEKYMHDNALQVRVPDMPETANRVFQVRVFTLDNPAPAMCEAGSIRIGGNAAGKVG